MYLITRSDDYYPRGGTSDWLCLRPDEGSAWEAFEEACRDRPHSGHSVYLIEIKPDATWRPVDYRDFEDDWDDDASS